MLPTSVVGRDWQLDQHVIYATSNPSTSGFIYDSGSGVVIQFQTLDRENIEHLEEIHRKCHLS